MAQPSPQAIDDVIEVFTPVRAGQHVRRSPPCQPADADAYQLRRVCRRQSLLQYVTVEASFN